jgi:DNA (cytosine-5)-methyltransferase 1
MKRGIVAVDLFCGAGGLTRGLLDIGIQVKKGYDIDSKVKDTYEKNNKGVIFFHKNIFSLKGEEILEGLDRKNNYFLLAGCAPCQPFSMINKQNIVRDNRKNLILKFAKLIEDTSPDFVLMENVPGLKNGKGKKIFSKFEKTLEKMKYNYKSEIVDAKNYGVPQKRKRLILLASKHFPVKIPESTHGIDKIPYITVKETISKYPRISSGMKHWEIPNHECRNLSEINLERLKYIKKNGGLRDSLPIKLILNCHKNYKGHSDVYGRMKLNDTAPTLTCKCTSISNGRFGHPTQNRGISVREAAALQTFRDNYVFYGTLTNTTSWVGNAVPVKFAESMGKIFVENV